MSPPEGENGEKEGGHEDEGVIEKGIVLLVVMIGMGIPLGEVDVSLGMAFPAGLNKTTLGNGRTRIISLQDAVISVAIGAPCDEGGVAQIFHLTVIALLIGLVGDEHHLISPHHVLIGMALLANRRVKGAAKFNVLRLFPRQDGDLVEPMTI